jgi:hypothetical protein
MTTFFNFTPSAVAPFSFSPVLDGQPYNASVPSLLFGNRYYLSLVASDGTPIIYTALIGSPTGVAIQSLAWANGRAIVLTAVPHGYKVGRIISLTIVGCAPTAYNGIQQALISGPSTFSYPLASNPGPATVLGNANYDVNLIGGVPNENGVQFTSTLVFRDQSQQFEVN